MMNSTAASLKSCCASSAPTDGSPSFLPVMFAAQDLKLDTNCSGLAPKRRITGLNDRASVSPLSAATC
eukprot:CAMPEP_0184300828 /NCGR_PEP_ID=MMETSP1049-20130417/11170_1 /TAXON_ID=77928 /ORGANISM="Proteomonas sulcata, Strain CCMP704" /LENGTH=67 /DNA_ID=CAMNT_0026611655 /DNA_START=933 /DNA_END=1136 /DNA_ORIENTATION=+